ncbi:MAG: LytR C-terminal domain-containing protein, partial [Methyloligellaceae bacterium]
EQTHRSEGVVARTPTHALAEQRTAVAIVKANLTQETMKLSPSRSTKQAQPSVLVVEVSNGAGRYRLAARTRRHFESRDLPVSYLTNAASYDNITTVIFYKKGKRDLAEKFARELPISARLEEYDKQYPHVRIRLGADVLDFDKEKLYATKIGAPNA